LHSAGSPLFGAALTGVFQESCRSQNAGRRARLPLLCRLRMQGVIEGVASKSQLNA
jgi:hypothetical protein